MKAVSQDDIGVVETAIFLVKLKVLLLFWILQTFFLAAVSSIFVHGVIIGILVSFSGLASVRNLP